MTGWDMYEELRGRLGEQHLLDQLANALSADELHENMEFIARVNDIGMESDDYGE